MTNSGGDYDIKDSFGDSFIGTEMTVDKFFSSAKQKMVKKALTGYKAVSIRKVFHKLQLIFKKFSIPGIISVLAVLKLGLKAHEFLGCFRIQQCEVKSQKTLPRKPLLSPLSKQAKAAVTFPIENPSKFRCLWV